MQISMENIAKHDIAPMLEVQLELVGPEIIWTPEVGEAAGGGHSAHSMAHSWIRSFFDTGTLMKRLDTGEGAWMQPAIFSHCAC